MVSDHRKIIRIGEKSYAITIPKKWVKQLGIKPGDYVDIVLDKPGIIKIYVEKNIPQKNILTELSIDASDLSPETILKIVETAYIFGVNKMVIRNMRSHEFRNKLSDLVKKLPGLFILETGENKILLKIALHEDIIDIDEIITNIAKLSIEIVRNLTEQKPIENIYSEAKYLLNSGLRAVEKKFRTELLRPNVSLQLYESLLLLIYFEKLLKALKDLSSRGTRIPENIIGAIYSALVKIYQFLSGRIDKGVIEAIRQRIDTYNQAIKTVNESCELKLIQYILNDLFKVILHRYTTIYASNI